MARKTSNAAKLPKNLKRKTNSSKIKCRKYNFNSILLKLHFIQQETDAFLKSAKTCAILPQGLR